MNPVRKKRNLFMLATILCGFLSIIFGYLIQALPAVTFNTGRVAVIFFVLASFFGGLWLKNQRILKADQSSIY